MSDPDADTRIAFLEDAVVRLRDALEEAALTFTEYHIRIPDAVRDAIKEPHEH